MSEIPGAFANFGFLKEGSMRFEQYSGDGGGGGSHLTLWNRHSSCHKFRLAADLSPVVAVELSKGGNVGMGYHMLIGYINFYFESLHTSAKDENFQTSLARFCKRLI
ncbi:hypothetical protein V9T40_011802 [Parthenolecanium corni]|uniref:Uncharacterized protein n=1 Tax=Parthenolecanium corni TaxID=536013 RepID=A0AAN9T7R1_9HEMI